MARARRRLIGIGTFGLTCILAVGAAAAQDAEDLRGRAERTVAAVEMYIQATEAPRDVPASMAAEVSILRGHATALEADMREIVRLLDRAGGGFAPNATFNARFDAETRTDLFSVDGPSLSEAVAEAQVRRLQSDTGLDGVEIRCCPTILEGFETAPEFALAGALTDIWTGFDNNDAARARVIIADSDRIVAQFRRKLLDGFPAMPWEFALNFQGTEAGPTPHQLVWLHPSLGLEVRTGQLPVGTNHLSPVLVIQMLGYNRYLLGSMSGFQRAVNYLGFAAAMSLNAEAGRDRLRYGGLMHVGNYVSVGATYGDADWQLLLSSSKLLDVVMGAVN